MFVFNFLGYEFGKAFDFAVRFSGSTSYVLDGGTSSEASEGDDLGDAIVAIFVEDVLNDVIAFILGKINIEIRQAYSGGIEESFEHEVPRYGVEGRDTRAPSDKGSGPGSSTWSDGDFFLFCPIYEV